MTVTRWWDPGVPVDLLTPGGDPYLDAANQLVALHRTGAAALLAAANTPLCDAGTVADALELTAAAAQVEISKVDVDTAVTAANAGANFVYRVAVAKGVIPPQAAARAAKIYGVPPAMLGRYPQIAADPRTPEPVLIDTADRTLFGWVAATAGAPTDVTKAVETPDERRNAQASQPRAAGRYASRGGPGEVTETTIDGKPIAQWLAENLAPAPEVATPPKPEPSAPKTVRNVRSVRNVRQVVSGARATGARATGSKAKMTKARMREALGATARSVIEEARANAARISRPVPEPFGTTGDRKPMEHAAPVRAPGSLVLPLDEYEHFRHGMARGDAPGEIVFEMGSLNTYVQFSPTARVDVSGSPSHDESVRYVAEQIVDQPDRHGLPDPIVWELTEEEEHELDIAITDQNRPRRDRIIRDIAANRLRMKQDELGLDDRDLAIAQEVGYVDYHLDYEDGETPLLVWRPPVEFGDYTTHRPRTNLAEVVIEDGVGETDVGGRHVAASNRYDPVMPLSVREDPDPVTYFDRRNKAVVYQVSAKMIEDDEAEVAFKRHADKLAGVTTRGIPGFHNTRPDGKPHDPIGKAESDDTRRNAQAGQPRAAGRYAAREATDASVTETTIDGMPIADWLAQHLVPADTEPVTPPARQPGQVKHVKTVRTVRSVRPVEPAAGSHATGSEAVMTEATMTKAAMHAARSRVGSAAGPDELALHDGTVYHLTYPQAFKDKTGIADDTAHGPLDKESRMWVDTLGDLDDSQVVVALFKRQMRRKNEREGIHWHRTPVLDTQIDVSLNDEYGNNIGHEQAIEWVARELHSAFKRDKNLGALEISLRRVWVNGREHVRVLVKGNARALPDQTMIRRGDVDPAAPMLITWEGRRRTLNLDWIRNDIRGYWPLKEDRQLPGPQSNEATMWMTNPWVEQWVVHSPDEYLRDT